MWDEFVEPIRSGEYGTRNFSQLYVRQKNMFRVEQHILDEVVPRESFTSITTTSTTAAATAATATASTAHSATMTTTNPPPTISTSLTDPLIKPNYDHDLPYYSKFLLLASYLASYNPSRLDIQFFTKSSDKRHRRRRGGALGGGAGPGRKSQNQQVRKIQRRLLGPQPFLLERMLAIFHAIVPDPVVSSVDIQTQVWGFTKLLL